MDASAPRIDLARTTPPIGYHQFHDDISINFQCNRWVQWIGPSAIDEVSVLASRANTYPELIDGFLALAERARAADRAFAGAYYDRAAEFFMTAADPRRPDTRARFLHAMRTTYGVTPDLLPYGSGRMPAYDLRPERQLGPTVVMFGGFDSYVEEFLPMVASLVDAGRRIVVFEGPGQGSALEDFGLTMIPEWEQPVAAVLDHYRLDDVAAVGISLGGGLVIRAAAFEPRISRVVAFDILDDFFEATARQIGRGTRIPLRAMLNARARRLINGVAYRAAARKPVSEWGLQQGMHVTGTATPYDFLRSTTAMSTRKISQRIHADVLLIAGADDHYVPLSQLGRQAGNLTNARSVTTRTFTAAEQASNHCQLGNIGAVSRLIDSWLDSTAGSLLDGDAAARTPTTVCHLAGRAPVAESDGLGLDGVV
jgi:pimeloyl-ACP methyl ester carboxylesterase